MMQLSTSHNYFASKIVGVLSTYSSWALVGCKGSEASDAVIPIPCNSAAINRGLMLAAYASCSVMRTASYSSYQVAGRAMVAEHVIGHLNEAAKMCLTETK